MHPCFLAIERGRSKSMHEARALLQVSGHLKALDLEGSHSRKPESAQRIQGECSHLEINNEDSGQSVQICVRRLA